MQTNHNPILHTKLHRPPVPADYVHRSLIMEYLDGGSDRPLTLVSAPAGYGKSILISSWLATIDRSGAWLSLDEKDNDLRRFLSHSLAGVQTIFPAAGLETLSMLKAADLPPLPSLPISHPRSSISPIFNPFQGMCRPLERYTVKRNSKDGQGKTQREKGNRMNRHQKGEKA